jgi:hypothetical protein
MRFLLLIKRNKPKNRKDKRIPNLRVLVCKKEKVF